MPPAATAWLYGPTAAGALSVWNIFINIILLKKIARPVAPLPKEASSVSVLLIHSTANGAP